MSLLGDRLPWSLGRTPTANDFIAGLAEEFCATVARVRLEWPHDCIGEQLGQAVAKLLDAEGDEQAVDQEDGRVFGWLVLGGISLPDDAGPVIWTEGQFKEEANNMLRAKMYVTSVTQDLDAEGKVEAELVKLSAVYGDEGSENADWAQWTPYASLEMQITNPEFYVDLVPVEQAE
jgi:hypothetical protein